MSRTLDIVITHYQEPWEIGKPLFTMLSLQRGIDFRDIHVFLINDGEEKAIPQRFIDMQAYPFETEVITIPHGGISAARNAGLLASSSEWITFCDFDDTYSNVYSLWDIIQLFPTDRFDLLYGKMLVEDFIDGKKQLYLSPDRTNFVFTHGKFYRRQFLIDNKICFDTDLAYNEDSLFNALIIAVLDYHRIGEIKAHTPFYIWCRRENSVTSKDGATDPATYGHFRRNWKVCDFYREHLPVVRLQDMVVRSVYDAYYMLNNTPLSEEMHSRIRKELRDYLLIYNDFWHIPDDEILEKIQWMAKYELSEKGLELPDDIKTVEQWKNEILLTGGE